jgi:hypothetical protein
MTDHKKTGMGFCVSVALAVVLSKRAAECRPHLVPVIFFEGFLHLAQIPCQSTAITRLEGIEPGKNRLE